MQLLEDHRNLLRGTEQEWTVYAEDAEIIRNGLVLQDVHTTFIHVSIRYLGDGRRDRYLADEQQSCQDHSRFDGNRQIGENRQQKSDNPDRNIRLAQLEDV